MLVKTKTELKVPADTLEEMVLEWRAISAQAAQLRERKKAIEASLLPALFPLLDEGSKTVREFGHKIKATGQRTYSGPVDKVQEFSEAFGRSGLLKPEIRGAGMKNLRRDFPDEFSLLESEGVKAGDPWYSFEIAKI